MSDTVKIGDVIALPVRINEPTFIDDAGDSPLAKVRRNDQAAAIARVINDHDRLVEENERLRGALNSMLGACTRYLEEQIPSESNLYDPDYRSPLSIARAALQACDAQQEPTNAE